MKISVKKTAQFIFFLSLGIFLIWYSVKNLSETDKSNILSVLKSADYTYILLSVLFGIIAHLLRANRWLRLIKPLGYNAKLMQSFTAVMIGYMANYAFTRLGELSRPAYLYKYEKIPVNISFGTIIMERFIDMILYFLFVGVAIIISMNVLSGYLQENLIQPLSEKVVNSKLLIISIGTILGLGFAAIFFLRKKIKKILSTKLLHFISGFTAGVKSIVKMENRLLFAIESLAIWVMYFLMLFICFFSFQESKNLGFEAGLISFVFGTLMVMVTPGGIGAYPLAIQSILSLYALNSNVGFAIGWIAWLSQFITVMLAGIILLIVTPLINTENSSNNGRE